MSRLENIHVIDLRSPSLNLAQVEAELEYRDNCLAFDAWLIRQHRRREAVARFARNAIGAALFAATITIAYLLGLGH